MAGKFITIAAKGGGKFRAYVATPPGGKGPGLLLLQEIFGINAHVRELADRYAEEGYLCVAPDLFWRMKPGVDLGYSEADFKQAFDYYQRFDVDLAITDVAILSEWSSRSYSGNHCSYLTGVPVATRRTRVFTSSSSSL